MPLVPASTMVWQPPQFCTKSVRPASVLADAREFSASPQPDKPGSYPVAMPQNLVTGQDAIDVSAYVAKFAGMQPDSDVREISPAVKGTPPAPGDGPATPADGGAEVP